MVFLWAHGFLSLVQFLLVLFGFHDPDRVPRGFLLNEEFGLGNGYFTAKSCSLARRYRSAEASTLLIANMVRVLVK